MKIHIAIEIQKSLYFPVGVAYSGLFIYFVSGLPSFRKVMTHICAVNSSKSLTMFPQILNHAFHRFEKFRLLTTFMNNFFKLFVIIIIGFD